MAVRFEFATAARIVFGCGKIAEAGALARPFGRRALVITGANPQRARPLLDSLQAQQIEWTSLAVRGEPDLDLARRGAEQARRERCELVIGIGGGSVIDSAKAVAALATNEGDLLDYLEVIGRAQPLPRAPLPCLAIPTTAGTGSEVTRNAVLAAPGQRVKVSLRSPLMLPQVAILDPELTVDLPPSLTATTGMDALTQLIEPYVCSRANPLTDALCVEGITRVARSLRTAFRDGRNTAAREDMCVASLFGGLALANAGLGAVHGFAGPIGGMFPAPHGAICAALLPHVAAANITALRRRQAHSESLHRYTTVACLLTGRPNATADDAVNWLRELLNDLQIPSLTRYGLSLQDVPEIVAKSEKASSMKANPLPLTRDELQEILGSALAS